MPPSVITRRDTVLGAVTAATGLAVATTAHANQPHMQSALSSLHAARDQLQAAKHDKGGHRAKALSLVEQAIREVNLGVEAGAA